MKELEIECDYINKVSASRTELDVTLGGVNMSFLEDLETRVIINNHNNEKLLKAMDTDELIEYVLKNVEIKNVIATELGMV